LTVSRRPPANPAVEKFPGFPVPEGLRLSGSSAMLPQVRKIRCALIAALLSALPGGLRADGTEPGEPLVTQPSEQEAPAVEAPAAEPAAVEAAAPVVAPIAKGSSPGKVVVIPIRAQIAKPELYILRRGIKEAIEKKVDTIILDMETPGGALDVTFDILLALEKFPGKTVTYVNREAISAGALISAGTDEIYFAPGSVIGAAAPVLATGGEIDETMKAKINSYLTARVRSISEGKGFRGEVLTAMIDADFEFKIGDQVISPAGKLLSLTAQEAMKTYGDPPIPLLGAGIAEDIDELLIMLHGSGEHSVLRLEVTWSERLAQYLTSLTPLLLGIGMLCLFIEFKTPGFGIFGVTGLTLLGVVFFGHYVAGLSGYEPALVFLLGALLVAVELFFFPGTMVFALSGVALMLGSLVWAMLDLWPGEPISFSGDALVRPLANVLTGVLLAIVLFFIMLKYLPSGGPWGRLVLETVVGGEPGAIRALNSNGLDAPRGADLIGRTGVAATAMFPSGQVEIDGKRYEAKLAMGFADAGSPVTVTDVSEFGIIVEVLS
jgi:membrane-bound serine protease (ClpP class)